MLDAPTDSDVQPALLSESARQSDARRKRSSFLASRLIRRTAFPGPWEKEETRGREARAKMNRICRFGKIHRGCGVLVEFFMVSLFGRSAEKVQSCRLFRTCDGDDTR
jgi:hypothetical protein